MIFSEDNFRMHCVKTICIWSYSGPHFSTFGLNTERYRLSLRIHSECEKIRTRITPSTNTFHVELNTLVTFFLTFLSLSLKNTTYILAIFFQDQQQHGFFIDLRRTSLLSEFKLIDGLLLLPLKSSVNLSFSGNFRGSTT